MARNDGIPGFSVDRALQTLAFGADVLAVLAYFGLQPKDVPPALPVFILAALATSFTIVILARHVIFAFSFDANDFPPGYVRGRVLKAIGLFVVAAAIATLAASQLD